MKESRNRISAAVFFAVFVLLLANQSAPGQVVSISIPYLHTTPKERIVGFELRVKAGRIATLPEAPIGWNISVENDPSWNTDIRATVIVGAAALDPSFFRDFLIIEKGKPLGVPFDIEGTVIVTEDFESQKQIKIGVKDLAIREIASDQRGRSK
jgi:hypothetical protein